MAAILYSDSHIVVCVKPAGVLSQDSGEASMPGLLRAQLGVPNVFVVHRLDRDTGGVMVYALTPHAAAALSKAVQDHKLKKHYLTVLRGVPAQESATLEDLLFHDKTRNKTYVVDRQRKGVKDAKLDYHVVRTVDNHSLVRVRLHTGRTHQIRVQFASRKLPLVGDGKYGGKANGHPLCLWSCQLSFPHPITGKAMTFEAMPPWEKEWETWFTEASFH